MKSPLGKNVYVTVDTKEKWIQLMEALEKHEVDYRFSTPLTKEEEKANCWEYYKEKTAICFGYISCKDNILGCGCEKDCMDENFLTRIEFEDAIKLLSK